MLFSSNVFIFRFLFLFMIVYLLVKPKDRNLVLLFGSLLFYGIGEPNFVWILVASIIVNYLLAGKILEKKSKVFLVVSLILNFGILGLFKYWDFGIENINAIAGKEILPLFSLALPLGISF